MSEKPERTVALLVPVNSLGEILIQDRTGHKPPPWGFFGGGLDEGETPLEAVLRETKEELNLELQEEELTYMGMLDADFPDRLVHRYLFLWRTDQEEFTVLEGAGAVWMSHATAEEKLDPADTISEVMELIYEKC